MKLITKTAIAAALSAIALSASAMTPIQDADLSQVSGQDGVSIAADLHVNVGSFVYKDTDSTGGAVSFNDIKINGTFAMTLDIINNATFTAAIFNTATGGLGALTPTAIATAASVAAYNADFLVNADPVLAAAAGSAAATASAAAGGAAYNQGVALTGFAPGGDVVKIAIPNIAVAAGHELNMSVGSIKLGNTVGGYGASFGSFAMNDIKLQGTTVYIWAH